MHRPGPDCVYWRIYRTGWFLDLILEAVPAQTVTHTSHLTLGLRGSRSMRMCGPSGIFLQIKEERKSKVLVAHSCPTLCNSMDCSPSGSFAHGIRQARNTRVYCHSFFQGIFPTQESNPGYSALQADSLLSEPPGKPQCKYNVGEMLWTLCDLWWL